MNKYAILLVLLCSVSALESVALLSDQSMILRGGDLALTVNPLSNSMSINNIITVPLFPKVTVDNKVVPTSTPTAQLIAPGEKVIEYEVDYPEEVEGDIYVSSKVVMNDDFVRQEFTIENTGDNEVSLEAEILPTERGNYYVYAPYKVEPSNKYITISPFLLNEKGQNVVVLFERNMPSYPQIQEVNLKTNLARTMSWNIKLGGGQTETIVLRYSVGYISDTEKLRESNFNPSISKQLFLNADVDPIFKLNNINSISTMRPTITDQDTSTAVMEKIRDELNKVPAVGEGKFSFTNTIDFSAITQKRITGMNSLEKAIVFRELARKEGIPSEIRIGVNNEQEYYAWAIGYSGLTQFNYDPEQDKGSYKEVYREPEPEVCKENSIIDCNWRGGVSGAQVCIGPICIPFFIPMILVVLIVGGVVGLFVYRPSYLYGILGTEIQKGFLKVEETGTYTITNEGFEPKNPLEKSVWDEIRRRGGVFNLGDYTRETGFSKVLILSMIEKLVEEGYIKRNY